MTQSHMERRSPKELQAIISNLSSSRLERVASSFLLGRDSSVASLNVLLALAQNSSLPREVLDEIGRSLGRVAHSIGAVEEVNSNDIYLLDEVAFKAFDQEVAIRNFLQV